MKADIQPEAPEIGLVSDRFTPESSRSLDMMLNDR